MVQGFQFEGFALNLGLNEGMGFRTLGLRTPISSDWNTLHTKPTIASTAELLPLWVGSSLKAWWTPGQNAVEHTEIAQAASQKNQDSNLLQTRSLRNLLGHPRRNFNFKPRGVHFLTKAGFWQCRGPNNWNRLDYSWLLEP